MLQLPRGERGHSLLGDQVQKSNIQVKGRKRYESQVHLHKFKYKHLHMHNLFSYYDVIVISEYAATAIIIVICEFIMLLSL